MNLINPRHKIIVSIESSATVNADRDRIGQVLINFLTNAVKYAPGSDTILIKSFIENNYVVVSVEDFGIGISKKTWQEYSNVFIVSKAKMRIRFQASALAFSLLLRLSSDITVK